MQAMNTCNLCDYMLLCDRSSANYTRNILQFNAENTQGVVDSIIKVHLEKWPAGCIAQYLFTYVIL